VKKTLSLAIAILCMGLMAAQSITIDQLFFNAGEPTSPQGEFVRYIRGGFLTSGNYYQFFSPDDAVKHMEAASLSAFRLNFSQFPQQSTPLASYVISLGILDNLGMVQGEINGRNEGALFADLVSLGGGYMLPLMNYGAYVSGSARSSLFYQTALYEKFNTLGTEFTYAHDFELNGSELKVNSARPLEASAEASVKAGIKVYKNWYASLALGLRVNGSTEGKWYKTSDVEAVHTADDLEVLEFNYWTDATLPARNYFFSGTSYFLNLSISPFY